MTSESERRSAKGAAHAMRIAVLRLVPERAFDPSAAYGCVDWFRYDAAACSEEADATAQPAPADALRAVAAVFH